MKMIHVRTVCKVQIVDTPEHSTHCTLDCKTAKVFRPERAYEIGTNALNTVANGGGQAFQI